MVSAAWISTLLWHNYYHEESYCLARHAYVKPVGEPIQDKVLHLGALLECSSIPLLTIKGQATAVMGGLVSYLPSLPCGIL